MDPYVFRKKKGEVEGIGILYLGYSAGASSERVTETRIRQNATNLRGH